ncbi:MAG: AbrB/MazE/SpoVT family DNA-binding domain-containing protein [Methanosarcinales archaeon]|nr:AbrB/MazE/SpoVT family DNA-binding domain-containing protein [Methanosarcinales archaeon]
MESITLSTKGQIIIPARIRKKYGMKKGEKLLITDENNYIKIIPKTRLADLVGSVKLDIIIVKKQIEEMRKEDRY